MPVKQTIYRIPALLMPSFSEVTKHSMKITWAAAEYSAVSKMIRRTGASDPPNYKI